MKLFGYCKKGQAKNQWPLCIEVSINMNTFEKLLNRIWMRLLYFLSLIYGIYPNPVAFRRNKNELRIQIFIPRLLLQPFPAQIVELWMDRNRWFGFIWVFILALLDTLSYGNASDDRMLLNLTAMTETSLIWKTYLEEVRQRYVQNLHSNSPSYVIVAKDFLYFLITLNVKLGIGNFFVEIN